EIDFAEGDLEQPRVTNRVHSDEDKPPEVKAGEILMQHERGHKIFFDKDGNVNVFHKIDDNTNSQIMWDKDGNIKLNVNNQDHFINVEKNKGITSSTKKDINRTTTDSGKITDTSDGDFTRKANSGNIIDQATQILHNGN